MTAIRKLILQVSTQFNLHTLLLVLFKCPQIELLKISLFINYWHIANLILSGRRLKKFLQPLNILAKTYQVIPSLICLASSRY